MTDPLQAAGRHPRLEGLARSPREALRLERFAVDLARYLYGSPPEYPLGRVVTLVAREELADARLLCDGRPLLAVEAAARTAAALWPLLRGPDESDAPNEDDDEDDAPPHTKEATDGDPGAPTGGSGEGRPGGSGEPDGGETEAGDEAGWGAPHGEPAPASDDTATPEDILEALAALEALDPEEVDGYAAALAAAMDGGGKQRSSLEELGETAENAAMEMDRIARHLERFLPGIGWSGAPGALERALLEQLDGLGKLLDRADDLRALADALGRLEQPEVGRGEEGGREETVGVTIGGDVTHALSCELALLADPDTEDLFYQRLIERRLVSLELDGGGDGGRGANAKRGPVIACIDTSGSMEGAPELAAKALVLAVCRRVLPRGRTVHLILFGGEGERTEIRLRRGRGKLEALLDFLLGGFRSGTDFDGPLLRALDLLEEDELRRADVLVVTDGMCRASPRVVDRVNAVRQALRVKVWSVVLGKADPRGVALFSDRVLALDPEGAASASGLLRRL